ncbi:conserved oligomeric Golgi complex subunit 3 isoform X2 [Prionailurus viverrinus]|nr:conserved oligomeric Golgi complex subunit 3 isoform X2 [Felis catus]XP_040304417.1 conserved oligomeric Golgi complex subunit 3 isoform X2 [Puma yagouaroundi]XP_042829434.1 conserved oligomeric Golgi complex subunit 3 isoform X2 [Panthera tigris]XP_043434980.1 conserved oligomeric Golgi complex subunit 3 isoform X2 [Prionailurus bengalensis]XP_047704704.1 conserved oligomeric Golgi complex subunit 3 isoform X2 [Prionailurus viverrinus]
MAEAALLLPPEAAAERDAREKLALWDRRPDTTAPLTDRQTDSVLELKAAVENLPVPAELPLEDLCSLTSQSLPAAEPSIVPESTEDILLKGFISLEMEEERIETAQQFFSWFAKLQTQMDQDEETKYRQMRDYLSGFQEQCDAILNDVNSALQHLESLQKQYLFVSNKTGTLHEACEQLLKEQSELVDLAENIQQKLSYFNELETINTKLNSPTLSVNSEGFIPMLAKLDDCITYISSHPHFKDYPVYLLKFKQCLSKALHLMKTYTVNTLQNLTSQLLKRDPASVPNADNAFTLFYVKFRAAAPKVRTIIEQIEQRSEKIPEYQQLLNDIHQCYLDQRELLLGPSITCTVTELTSQNNRDHCALIRSGCAFMVHVCQDEHQLYNEFFTKPTSKLDELLEKLCVSLYDVFRPLIIHVIHLETLSELCGILKNEVLEDHVQNNAEQLGAFAAGVKQMLEDVQERLVYRTHIYIQTDITGYKPAPGDLAYPDKLVMMEQIAQSLKDEQKKVPSEASFSDVQLEETESNNLTKSGSTESLNPRPQTTISPADLHGMWYPTVRRTLVCLSKLYRCIDRAVFQGLSQEALSACIQSLLGASESISKNKIAPFHTEFTIKEISLDLKKTRDAAFKILNPMTVPRFFRLNSNNALIEFLLEGTPEIREHYLDSKKDVDRHLKSACEQFIQQQTKQFVEQLEEFMTKVSALKTMASQGGPKYTLSQQPWAQPAKVCELVASAYKTIKAKLPLTLRSMSLYLSNKDTEFILFKPVRNNIQQVFQKFHVLLKEDFSPEDTQIIACPSMEQLNLLLSVSK